METLSQIQARLQDALPEAQVERLEDPGLAGQSSLLVHASCLREVARWLQADPQLQLDYASNVTGIDWPEVTLQEKRKVKQLIDGQEREIEQVETVRKGGYLEVVYHLYSMTLQHGPVTIRVRTHNRTDAVSVPSLTPVWRSAEFQEREVFDLFGVVFEGHPDLRRILMWDEFRAHPMRKDYVEPDDYEYEPTAHDAVLERARQHRRSP
jgi:NADH-quinone oxidoreductase subunit C